MMDTYEVQESNEVEFYGFLVKICGLGPLLIVYKDSELEKTMRKLDVQQMSEFLDALENYNLERDEELAYLKSENKRLKGICTYYLKEMWHCVPESERCSSAAFFKKQEDDIARS